MNGPRVSAPAEQIAQQGRHELHARLRAALLRQAAGAAEPVSLDETGLDALVQAAAARAGGMLWRRCLAGAAVDALGLELAQAIEHPDVVRAHELVGAPPYEPRPPEPSAVPVAPPPEGSPGTAPGAEAVRLAAVHRSGIESLRNGESDLELRFSEAGLDLLKASTGGAIGRLPWSEIQAVEVGHSRRGLRRGRGQELRVRAQRGLARFELPGLTAAQMTEHLAPVLARWGPERGG